MISSLDNLSPEHYDSISTFDGVANKAELNDLLQTQPYKLSSLEPIDFNKFYVKILARKDTSPVGIKDILTTLSATNVTADREPVITVKYDAIKDLSAVNRYRIISVEMTLENDIYLDFLPQEFT
jgi:hypothetical protein